jgi:flagellar assembly factor FliW
VRVETREMGPQDVGEEQMFEFCSPMLGFDSHRRYALIAAPDAPPFHWLQSVEEAELAFPVVCADELAVGYDATAEIQQKLGAISDDEIQFWVVVTIPSDGGQLRLNLRAPVAISTRTGRAAQIIMRDEYPIGAALAESRAG